MQIHQLNKQKYKMRSSFLTSITNVIVQKLTPDGATKEKKEDNECTDEGAHAQIKFQTELNSTSGNSFEVSFTLDKLYFDDNAAAKQESSKLNQKKIKLDSEMVQKEPQFFNQCLQPQSLQQESQKVEDTENGQQKKFIMEETFEQTPIKKESHLTPQKNSPIIQQVHYDSPQSLQQNNQDPPPPIQHPSTPTYQDQSTQANLSCITEQASSDDQSQQQDNSQNLSVIDMLLVYPENIKRYNQDNLLFVRIEELAKVYPLNLDLYEFVRLDPRCGGENQQRLFDAFLVDWQKSKNRISKKTLTLAKMRTIIIRDAMNTLVDLIIPPKDTEEFHLRISKTYRTRYIEAGVPIPPPRVNNMYLENLFSTPKIKEFYHKYVQQRLEIFLKDENYRRIEIYTLEIIKCYHLAKSKTVEQLVEILQRKKKPFTSRQLKEIMKEANNIGVQYGNFKKRIGNGYSRAKQSQKKVYKNIALSEESDQKTSKLSKKVKIENQVENLPKKHGIKNSQNKPIKDSNKQDKEIKLESSLYFQQTDSESNTQHESHWNNEFNSVQ